MGLIGVGNCVSVVLCGARSCLFACFRVLLSTETHSSSDARDDVKRKYSVVGGVVPRRAEFRRFSCGVNRLTKVGV
jgi:hypothetical protein